MFLPCSLRALCPSSPPVQGSGRDYCRSPLPCAGGSSGQSPRPTREGAGRAQSDQPHSVCPLCTLPAPSLPSGPPGGLPFCRIRTPCRVAVAPIAAPSYSARGSSTAKPPPAPRPVGRSRPPPKGAPHFELILDMVDIPLIFH